MKSFEVAFAIGAGLAASFNTTVGLASQKVNDLGKAVKGLEQQQVKIDTFRGLHRETETARKEFLAARQEAAMLKKELAGVEKPTKKMTDALARAEKKSERLREAWLKKGRAMRDARREMESAGMQVKGLAARQDGLARALDRTRRAQVALNKASAAQQANMARRDDLGGKLAVAAASAASVAVPVKLAIDFESAMADVKKVVDFKTPDGLQLLQRDILSLSTDKKIPLAAEGIAQIVASAGQAGLADDRQSLMQFASDAAKMGVAFDTTAAEAGETLAAWRSSMGLTQDRAKDLADAVNHVSNKMNAKAAPLAEVIRRQGAVGMSAGLTEQQVASLGGALLSSGSGPEIAATALKNLTGALTKGSAAARDQQEAFSTLGLDAGEMAARMQEDAPAAIREVFTALAEAPKEEQNALVSRLFGEESKGAIMPLLTNLGNLDKAFDLTSNKAKYAGSMTKEFEERSRTTANSLVLLKNEAYRLAINIGTTLLPTVNSVAGGMGSALAFGSRLTEQFPKTTAAVVGLGAGAAGLAVAGLALGYVGTFVHGGWLRLSKLWAVLNVKMALVKAQTIGTAVAQRGLALGTKAVTAAQWAWNAALTANPIGVAVVAAAALGTAAYQAYKHWDAIKGGFQDVAAWLKGQDWSGIGSGLIKSLASGMWSAAGLPYAAAKMGLAKVRELLPFSDAKQGPLADLTLSGKKIPETMAVGVKLGAPNLAGMTTTAMQSVQTATAQQPAHVWQVAADRRGAVPPVIFNQTVNLTGGGESAATRQAVSEALRESEARLRKMVTSILTDGRRLSYG